MEIQSVSFDELKRVIDKRAPIGLFYTKHDGRYIAVENRTGAACTEKFDSLNACYAWLRKEGGV